MPDLSHAATTSRITGTAGAASAGPLDSERVYDLIGIGVGPFNLGLAALADPVAELDVLFLDQAEEFNWHPGMMLPDAHLQVPFIADLVTMADPTSPYSFLNYLKQQGRLYQFYIREDFYPLRAEYNKYCQWVAQQLPVRFGTAVTAIDHRAGEYMLRVTDASGEHTLRTRKIVLGTGSIPYLPPGLAPLHDRPGQPHLLHSSEYLSRKAELQQLDSVTVLGSGQSAAEIYHDLLSEQEQYGYELIWLTRSPRFFPLEYTKLTLEMTSPEYIDYFHELPPQQRAQLGQEQKNLYKGIDSVLINAIYDLLYQRSVAGPVPTRLLSSTEVESAEHNGAGYTLTLRQMEQGKRAELRTGGLIAATGYSYRQPEFLEGVRDRLVFDVQGQFAVDRGYSISAVPGEVFVQNAELHTHGFTAPDLGMGPYRNSCILRSVLGREVYPVEQRIAFQEFGVAKQSAPVAVAR
ncbi:lysine N(6)-hydroxylase/L-ornithine N(5)-oxygenase family protein [Acaricomes phytoseiuli]|uniref:lysine N(6)-hydroxylase/L-ornithine N(5)-oxygenase family protein n=1 Tax=Acaricomes phytoseiuli TaxID=291968 RepID=UPI0022228B7E|nr:lysine N(6)-hydroxylase/L-ornithine N(5)-oxygenase family protein [Acaricomes phytoseiuli]MCW1249453.1 lysine N(6)-hydroxylase/L-ornithine N(5)-oxygenase family protein [Acaricomes phytoseiuli]